MKMQIRKSKQISFIRSFAVLSAASVTLMFSNSSIAYDEYQYSILFNPTENVLEAEERGRIMIYDGLKNEEVEKAMTEQFERIENMMFVRTVHIQENGEFEVDDDCD